MVGWREEATRNQPGMKIKSASTLFARTAQHLGTILILFRVYSCDISTQANPLISLAAVNAHLVPNTILFKSQNISADSFPSCII